MATKKSEAVSLSAAMAGKRDFRAFRVWIIGDTPIITHAWSEKAKREMLQKQVKAPKSGREAKNPEENFVNSLYPMGDNVFGFPVTGVKSAIVASAHKDKGIAREAVLRGLFLNAEMVRVMPALKGAICDLPLVRIHGGKPEMREDMVRVGKGLSKTADLAYRAQFWPWAMQISGKYNGATLNDELLAFLIEDSGLASGLGDWRNEKRGIFGSYHLASEEEDAQWTAFSRGEGKLPTPEPYAIAAE